MAKTQSKLASVDPVWDQIKYDARQAAAAEPLIGGFVHATILHHASIGKALSYRIGAKLSSNEMSMMVVREIVDQAYTLFQGVSGRSSLPSEPLPVDARPAGFGVFLPDACVGDFWRGYSSRCAHGEGHHD